MKRIGATGIAQLCKKRRKVTSPSFSRKKVLLRDSKIETFGASFFADQLASSLITHSLLSFPFPSPTCVENWPGPGGEKSFIIMAIRDRQTVAARRTNRGWAATEKLLLSRQRRLRQPQPRQPRAHLIAHLCIFLEEESHESRIALGLGARPSFTHFLLQKYTPLGSLFLHPFISRPT